MSPAETGAYHATINSREWHAARAEAARQAATAPHIDQASRDYLRGMAEWHQQRADVAAKMARETLKQMETAA
jgi:hypothetical protein